MLEISNAEIISQITPLVDQMIKDLQDYLMTKEECYSRRARMLNMLATLYQIFKIYSPEDIKVTLLYRLTNPIDKFYCLCSLNCFFECEGQLMGHVRNRH